MKHGKIYLIWLTAFLALVLFCEVAMLCRNGMTSAGQLNVDGACFSIVKIPEATSNVFGCLNVCENQTIPAFSEDGFRYGINYDGKALSVCQLEYPMGKETVSITFIAQKKYLGCYIRDDTKQLCTFLYGEGRQVTKEQEEIARKYRVDKVYEFLMSLHYNYKSPRIRAIWFSQHVSMDYHVDMFESQTRKEFEAHKQMLTDLRKLKTILR
ncbi:MAG: hypothetical protein ABFD69_13325 [Candidatus Sumerlaeia bacterium]